MKAGGAPTASAVAAGDLVLQMLSRRYHELGKRLKECGWSSMIPTFMSHFAADSGPR
jgi:hypothetical protein